jgi:hypothetical protein
MAKIIRTVTSPHTKHTSQDATYATLQHTKQTNKLLLRAPAISPGFVLERHGHPPSHKTSCVVRLHVRLLMPPGHRLIHSSGVYTKTGSVLPLEEGGGGGKSAIAKCTITGDTCTFNEEVGS